jgi:methylmalonyl-CoA mutase
MADTELQSAFGATSGIEDWRKLVEKALSGRDPETLNSRTRDDIVVEPLYAARRDVRALSGRGPRAWAIVQPIDEPDADRAHSQAQADLQGGASGLSLRFAGSPAAAGFGLPASKGALAAALDGVDLAKVQLRIEPSANCLQSPEWLADLAARHGIAPELTDISFGLDPVALLTSNDAQPPDAKEFAACFTALRSAHFRGPLALLDARPYHEAGASEAQELAGGLAAAAWWLRALGDAGVEPADALPLYGASVSVDRDVLLSIAKLRALRLLWARLAELCDAPRTPLAVHAETSRRMLTRADATTNLLRNTVAAFAAAVGGADAITVLPHTAAAGLAERSARALATNIQHLLIEESHLYVVADPAAGSGAIEALTETIAERAWGDFVEIERDGGIVESLRAGAFQGRITKARAALLNNVASGGAPLVGATIHSVEAESASAAIESPAALDGLEPIHLEDAAVKAAAA